MITNVVYRSATPADIGALASIRSVNSGSADYWQKRISSYWEGSLNPQRALASRTIFVAETENVIVGFIAGHLTTRFECDGELQWIDVLEAHRKQGIATGLFKKLMGWFIEQRANKICVDVGNAEARQFYATNGAIDLNEHWMVWPDVALLDLQK